MKTMECRVMFAKFSIATVAAVGFLTANVHADAQALPEITHPVGNELSFHDNTCEPRFRGGPCHDHCLDLWSGYCYERRQGFRAPVRPLCGIGLRCLHCAGLGCSTCLSGGCGGGGCAGPSCGSQPCPCGNAGCDHSCDSGCVSSTTPSVAPLAPPAPAAQPPAHEHEPAPVPAEVSGERSAPAHNVTAPEPAAPQSVATPAEEVAEPAIGPGQVLPENVPARPIPRNVTLPSTPEVQRESKLIVPALPAQLAARQTEATREVVPRKRTAVKPASGTTGTARLFQQLQSLSR